MVIDIHPWCCKWSMGRVGPAVVIQWLRGILTLIFQCLILGTLGCWCCSIGGGEPVGLNASVWRIVNPVVFRVSSSCWCLSGVVSGSGPMLRGGRLGLWVTEVSRGEWLAGTRGCDIGRWVPSFLHPCGGERWCVFLCRGGKEIVTCVCQGMWYWVMNPDWFNCYINIHCVAINRCVNWPFVRGFWGGGFSLLEVEQGWFGEKRIVEASIG